MNYQHFLDLALKRYPTLRIREKTTWWWRTLGFFFPLLKSNFTALYTTVWVPVGTKLEQSPYGLQILSHEVCHMDQIYYGGWRPIEHEYPMEKPRGFFHASLFYFLYFFWVFPVKFATFRAHAEMEAFLREFNQEGAETAGPEEVTETKKRNCLYYMTGPYYFWALTQKKAEEIFENESAKILRRSRES